MFSGKVSNEQLDRIIVSMFRSVWNDLGSDVIGKPVASRYLSSFN
jgi:hypothetical protein